MECCFCGESLSNGQPTVVLTEKGCTSINCLSETLEVKLGQSVHKKCRLDFIRPKKNGKRNCDEVVESRNITRRSSTSRFIWKEHCLFCGQPAKYEGRKRGYDVVPVRTSDFQDSISECCNARNDDWAETVRGRLEYARDLHAADAVYHQVCSINFRTGKQIPRKQDNEADMGSTRRKGRPMDTAKSTAFAKVAQFLIDNDEEQIAVPDLTTKMQEFLEGTGEQAYSAVYMKSKLQEYFGETIVITTVKNQNVVTFHRTAESIISEFYKQPKKEDHDAEKARIVETAAKLIKSDIKNLDASNSNYPSCEDMASIDQALEFIPRLLKLFLKSIFTGKDTSLKLASIGQAIIQAARPKAIVAPLQLGLGVQMHHHFASKFLIDSLNSHGFCSPYTVVQKYERSAAVNQGIDIPGFTSGSFIQHVADNVDHNLRTLDGTGTFHGMGIIATITPGLKSNKLVPRRCVTTEEIAAAGRVDISAYLGPRGYRMQLIYKELKDLRVQDATYNLDLLWKVSLPLLLSPRSGWSGTMQGICCGQYPGKSSVMFLPMIDLDPTDMTCVYSTLLFVSDQAKRYNITPVLTFDQPLWWKALTIVLNEPQGSDLKSIVLRLGGFHTQMSFLGCIGHLMAGSGLQELLELVYAKNAVIHMLSGKAVSRAIRGHFLVDSALNTVLFCKTFNVKLPTRNAKELSPGEDCAEQVDSIAQDLRPQSDFITDEDLKLAEMMFRRVEKGECTVEEVCSAEFVNRISEKLSFTQNSMKSHRTAVLWMTYMRMIDLLRRLIKAERTGNWSLHLQTVYDMLPYFVAAGHRLYAKSAYVYLQLMNELQDKHPEVYKQFQDGLHCARRSDRFWAGLSTDLMIEQVLMRSVKTSGGLTRGRGLSETQRLVWLMSMPACATVNDAMQTLTDVRYFSSEQHKDTTSARKLRDYNDSLDLVDYLAQRDPFSEDQSLRCIASGVVADVEVDVDKCKEKGDKVLTSLVGKDAYEYSFRKKDQAVTLASKTSITFLGENIQVDPQLLFQRLSFVATGGQHDNPQTFFKFEMCSYPPALFDSSLLPRQAKKPVLADAIWARTKNVQTAVPTGNVHYVIDGGALLHRIPWPRRLAYTEIFSLYVQYVTRKYTQATVVFDGYEEGPTTKDCTHQRRSSASGPTVNFDCDMVLNLKKEEFLRNELNKQRFIHLLGEKLEHAGCNIIHAAGDADLTIVQAAIRSSRATKTVLVGDDTDLLILLCHHIEMHANDLFFIPEPKQRSTTRKVWNIKNTASALGPEICASILFLHAVLGCDTTSALYGIGKGLALKKMLADVVFREQAKVFNQPDARKEEILIAGEKALLCVYNGKSDEILDSLRYSRFCQKITQGTTFVQSECLPPTSAAAAYHSLRVYWQVQQWKGVTLQPQDWGWKLHDGKLLPVKTNLPPAHESLLKIIRCNCKIDCSSQRCSCRKHGLDCSAACGSCRGQCCSNSAAPDLSENDD